MNRLFNHWAVCGDDGAICYECDDAGLQTRAYIFATQKQAILAIPEASVDAQGDLHVEKVEIR